MSFGRVVEVLRWLKSEHFEFFVVGGWGLDAVLGRKTRPHSDVDIVVFAGQREQLLALVHARDDVRVCEAGLPEKLLFAEADLGVPADIANKWDVLQARADGWAGVFADVSFFEVGNGTLIAEGVQWSLEVPLALLVDHPDESDDPQPPFLWRPGSVMTMTSQGDDGVTNLSHGVPVGHTAVIAKMQAAFAYHPGERDVAAALTVSVCDPSDLAMVRVASKVLEPPDLSSNGSVGGWSDIDD